jgi:predicted ribosomally synthesized peptide with SipW-like signal peptide
VKRILFSIMAVGLAIGLVGGAFAWFTDVEKTTGNAMSAGTLDMEIGDDINAFTNSPISGTFNSPVGLEPGQTFDVGPVYLKNVGTVDIRWIFARFCNLVETDGVSTDAERSAPTAIDISNKIILKKVFESNNFGASYEASAFTEADANTFLGYWNTRAGWNVFALDGSISLNDLVVARDYGSGDYVTSLLLINNPPFPNPALPAGLSGRYSHIRN